MSRFPSMSKTSTARVTASAAYTHGLCVIFTVIFIFIIMKTIIVIGPDSRSLPAFKRVQSADSRPRRSLLPVVSADLPPDDRFQRAAEIQKSILCNRTKSCVIALVHHEWRRQSVFGISLPREINRANYKGKSCFPNQVDRTTIWTTLLRAALTSQWSNISYFM